MVRLIGEGFPAEGNDGKDIDTSLSKFTLNTENLPDDSQLVRNQLVITYMEFIVPVFVDMYIMPVVDHNKVEVKRNSGEVKMMLDFDLFHVITMAATAAANWATDMEPAADSQAGKSVDMMENGAWVSTYSIFKQQQGRGSDTVRDQNAVPATGTVSTIVAVSAVVAVVCETCGPASVARSATPGVPKRLGVQMETPTVASAVSH